MELKEVLAVTNKDVAVEIRDDNDETLYAAFDTKADVPDEVGNIVGMTLQDKKLTLYVDLYVYAA